MNYPIPYVSIENSSVSMVVVVVCAIQDECISTLFVSISSPTNNKQNECSATV